MTTPGTLRVGSCVVESQLAVGPSFLHATVRCAFEGSGQFLLSFQVGLGLHALCSRNLVVQACMVHS